MAGSALQRPTPSVDKTAGMVQQAGQEGIQDPNETIGGDIPGSEPATPEEQDALDRVVTAGQAALMENEKIRNSVLDQVKNSQDPSEGIARGAVTLMGALDDQSQGQIPETVIFAATMELAEEIATLSNENPETPDIDEGVWQRSTEHVVSQLAEEYGIDPMEIQGLMDSVPDEEKQRIAAERGGYYA